MLIYLAESADLHLPLDGPELSQNAFVKSPLIKELFLRSNFEEYKYSKKSKIFKQMSFEGLGLLPLESLARLSQDRDLKKEQATIVSSGMRLLKHSSKFNRIGYLSKILLTSQNWHCKRFPMIWKRWDIKSNLSVFRLAPSAHYISENEFSLLPTPTTRIAVGNHYQRNRQGKVYPTLSGILKERLSPESVEAIMGFPIGWTASNRAVMQSSHKSPTKS